MKYIVFVEVLERLWRLQQSNKHERDIELFEQWYVTVGQQIEGKFELVEKRRVIIDVVNGGDASQYVQ